MPKCGGPGQGPSQALEAPAPVPAGPANILAPDTSGSLVHSTVPSRHQAPRSHVAHDTHAGTHCGAPPCPSGNPPAVPASVQSRQTTLAATPGRFRMSSLREPSRDVDLGCHIHDAQNPAASRVIRIHLCHFVESTSCRHWAPPCRGASETDIALAFGCRIESLGFRIGLKLQRSPVSDVPRCDASCESSAAVLSSRAPHPTVPSCDPSVPRRTTESRRHTTTGTR